MNGSAGSRLGKLGSILIPVIFVLAVSLAISWPLWTFATRDRKLYTLAVGVAIAAAILTLVGLAVGRRVRARAMEARAAAQASAATSGSGSE